MVSVVPFLPSFRWYAFWLAALRNGVSIEEATAEANAALDLGGKDFARCVLREQGNDRILSVPIVGGSASLKKMRNIPAALLSDHGSWRHNHLGAFEAIYGRAPFFSELFPRLREVYDSPCVSLSLFNGSLHKALLSILLPADEHIPRNLPEAALQRGREMAVEIRGDLSLLQSIMRFGPETILPLLAWNEK